MKIVVKVKTKAKEKKVVKIGDNNYEVWVKALPEKGKANMAVQKALAKYFKIPQTSIKIIAGKSSHKKIISF
ncbi:MAG: DUF167 domain-containing protein [bacterium]